MTLPTGKFDLNEYGKYLAESLLRFMKRKLNKQLTRWSDIDKNV